MITKLKVGTLELTESNGYYLSSIKDLGYKSKYPISSILYVHGSKLGNVYFQNRQLAFELKIIGNSLSDLISKRTNLYKALTINEFSDDFISIEITLSNGIVLTTQGVVKDVNSDIDSSIVSACDVSFVIETEEPFLKSKNIYQIDCLITKGGGGEIPASIPFDMSKGSSGYKRISNDGNIFSYPVLYFYGPLTNPVFTNQTLGKNISFNVSITAGHYFIVDTFNRTVIDDLGVNKRDKMSGDFLVVNSGDNDFSLITDNMSESGFVRVIYQNYYISI